ncbi:uncharacterized protein SPPG_04469 [Spizellomyces punctatus DAOM BR117]|uniref:Uncharacterized protein n=1 Tax=Spizellomyces punctatus (strain DAOM BR117) TaxID=645134 RepID=A0A0L0HGI3_SPIPD|nr:uncharacterized protein SPPG_04469 [Spizellomyces punctatus DAOM BR117]KND00127.1 hypothetical protein SPPG_04469 [Spizellomyces punctatus DAOM BR117]|eukprot:XP_016608166.1 hypothetical protein SPPG_04469 [Spizellomyces punctatus DAOM BR117]
MTAYRTVRFTFWLAIAFLVLAVLVQGQAPPPGNGGANGGNNTNQTNTTQPMPPCGTRPGSIIVDSPRSTTVVAVGGTLNISWHYSDFVDTGRFPARKVALYYQRADQAITNNGWKAIEENLPRDTRNYTWTIPSLQDAFYLIRYVMDDLDPQRVPANGNCVPDTFPGPTNSQQFKIMNSLPLVTTPDTMGPNSGAFKSASGIFTFVAVLVASTLALR